MKMAEKPSSLNLSPLAKQNLTASFKNKIETRKKELSLSRLKIQKMFIP